MTGPEHYAEAERLLERLGLPDGTVRANDVAVAMLGAAQVHATLALAAATWFAAPCIDGAHPMVKEWWAVAGEPVDAPAEGGV